MSGLSNGAGAGWRGGPLCRVGAPTIYHAIAKPYNHTKKLKSPKNIQKKQKSLSCP